MSGAPFSLQELRQSGVVTPEAVLALVAGVEMMDRLAGAMGRLKRSACFAQPEDPGQARLLVAAMEDVDSALREAAALWDSTFGTPS